MKKLIGYFLISLPIILLFIIWALKYGFLISFIVFAIALLFMFLVSVGVDFIEKK